MIPQITQENVHIFIPLKVAKICAELCRVKNISTVEAIRLFYSSQTSAMLAEESSKMWCEGWVSIYESLMDELAEHE